MSRVTDASKCLYEQLWLMALQQHKKKEKKGRQVLQTHTQSGVESQTQGKMLCVNVGWSLKTREIKRMAAPLA